MSSVAIIKDSIKDGLIITATTTGILHQILLIV